LDGDYSRGKSNQLMKGAMKFGTDSDAGIWGGKAGF
jgi:hypothetical protein